MSLIILVFTQSQSVEMLVMILHRHIIKSEKSSCILYPDDSRHMIDKMTPLKNL